MSGGERIDMPDGWHEPDACVGCEQPLDLLSEDVEIDERGPWCPSCRAPNEGPARGRTREDAVFDEHEEWPEMLDGCERKPFALDHHGANANRFASLRTVARKL